MEQTFKILTEGYTQTVWGSCDDSDSRQQLGWNSIARPAESLKKSKDISDFH